MTERNRNWASAPAANDPKSVAPLIGPTGPEAAIPTEKGPLMEVFMKVYLGDGGMSDSIRIGLTPTGRADLSSVPEEIRASWEEGGIKDPVTGACVKPEEGPSFLAMLVSLSMRSPKTYGPWFSLEKA